MYCPQCGKKFWFRNTFCPDCRVGLVQHPAVAVPPTRVGRIDEQHPVPPDEGDTIAEDAADEEGAADASIVQGKTHTDPQLTVVFTSSNPALIALAQSLLESEAIEYVTQDDMLHGLGVDGGAVRFWVRGDESERARTILQDLREASGQDESLRPENDR